MVWATLVTWLVLTVMFLIVAGPANPLATQAGFAVALSGGDAEAVQQAIQQYKAARGLDEPLLQRYVTFMLDLVTLNWGTSFTYGVPVIELMGERTAVTLAYVLPATLLSTLGGVTVGLWTTVKDTDVLDRFTVGVSYAGFGLPAFWIGLLLLALFGESLGFSGGTGPYGGFEYGKEFHLQSDLLNVQNLTFLLFPMTAMTVTLFAAQLRYVRSETREYLREDFVKRLRAAGANRWVLAKNILRNAALPLLAVLFTELLGSLFVSVFVVEAALGVPGLGDLAYTAVQQRDVPVVVTSMLFPVVLGVFGNLFQDVANAVLDPRLGDQ